MNMPRAVCDELSYYCDNECKNKNTVAECDGVADCLDGSDELMCTDMFKAKAAHMPVKGYPMPHLPGQVSDGVYRPSTDIVLTTVLPTILGCILLVAAMLFGIKKCKEWELDRIMEMRRTRRVVQRITDHLRHKNMETLQNMRAIRKRRATMLTMARLAREQELSGAMTVSECGGDGQAMEMTGVPTAMTTDPLVGRVGLAHRHVGSIAYKPPPIYSSFDHPPLINDPLDTSAIVQAPILSHPASQASPPPPYEEAFVDEYFESLFERAEREANMPQFAWTQAGLQQNVSSAASSRRTSRASTMQSMQQMPMSQRTRRRSNATLAGGGSGGGGGAHSNLSRSHSNASAGRTPLTARLRPPTGEMDVFIEDRADNAGGGDQWSAR